jgi:hypothetical protein
MKATQILKSREVLDDGAGFVEMVVWLLPGPLEGSAHRYKYRLAYVVDEVCVLRYDNEAGKGDHRHIGANEFPYEFRGTRQLLADFWKDVKKWSAE